MLLQPIHIQALRYAESRAYYYEDPGLTAAGFSLAEYRKLIAQLCAGGIIHSFHLTLMVPPLLGGTWVWAGILGRAEHPYETAHRLTTRLPFVTEILINSCFPANIGSNLALLFFSRDFENETRFIQNLSELHDVEVIKIAEYNYPVTLPLSSEEKKFIRFLIESPDADAETISARFGQNPNWVRSKIDRLLWTDKNPSGIFRIQPSIDWSKAENFGHFHFLLETGHRPEQIGRLLADQNFQMVMGGKPLAGRYITVEADVWGIPDLYQRIDFLEKLQGVRVAGLIYNQELLINDYWVVKTIGD
jgi:hypothetical protein